MLQEILRRFRETGEALSLEQLSGELNIDKSAMEGMLQTLVRQGKLKKVEAGAAECEHCGRSGSCPALHADRMGTVYELGEK